MTQVPVRELRNHTAEVIARVTSGDDVTITSNGVPVAVLAPVERRKRDALSRTELMEILRHQADSGLRDDLRRLAGDASDDLGLIE